MGALYGMKDWPEAICDVSVAASANVRGDDGNAREKIERQNYFRRVASLNGSSAHCRDGVARGDV